MRQTVEGWLLDRGVSESAVPAVYTLLSAVAVLVLSALAGVVARQIILRALHVIVQRSHTAWDDRLMERGFFNRLAHLAPALVIHLTAPVAFVDFPSLVAVVEAVAVIYMLVVGMAIVDSFLSAFLDVYQTFTVSRRVHIKSFVQVVKVVVFFLGGVMILANLVGRSPLVFFSGLGALSAILLLVFKDPILNLVAGIQLMSNNMVRRGDWIEMPKYGIDGDVLDVSLTTIKVQNWDKTIATIPPSVLVNDSFRNWRGMSESGGRRIKRAVNIDMNSVRFCDRDMVERFKRFQFIQEYLNRKLEEVNRYNREQGIDDSVLINGRHLTNVGTFRAYLEAYLRHHPKIHQDLTFLVRHLAPTPHGLPIEIYVFSNDQNWARYEGIQADIMDHILAVIPLFDLRVFQSPSGADVRGLVGASLTEKA